MATREEELQLELLKRAMAEIQAQNVPMASHAPVTANAVLATQLADIDRQRAEEMPTGTGVLMTGSEAPEDLASIAMGGFNGGGGVSEAYLPVGSPFRNPDYRRMRIAKLAKDLRKSDIENSLVSKFIERAKAHPRSYAQRLFADEAATIKDSGPMLTGAHGALELPVKDAGQKPLYSLTLNKQIANPAAENAVLVHEDTHLAKSIKRNDRARRSEVFQNENASTLEKLHRAVQEAHVDGDYHRLPDEIAARFAEEFNELKQQNKALTGNRKLTVPQMRRVAQDRAQDPVRANQRVEESFLTPEELAQRGQMNPKTFADRFVEILNQRKSELYDKFIKNKVK